MFIKVPQRKTKPYSLHYKALSLMVMCLVFAALLFLLPSNAHAFQPEGRDCLEISMTDTEGDEFLALDDRIPFHASVFNKSGCAPRLVSMEVIVTPQLGIYGESGCSGRGPRCVMDNSESLNRGSRHAIALNLLPDIPGDYTVTVIVSSSEEGVNFKPLTGTYQFKVIDVPGRHICSAQGVINSVPGQNPKNTDAHTLQISAFRWAASLPGNVLGILAYAFTIPIAILFTREALKRSSPETFRPSKVFLPIFLGLFFFLFVVATVHFFWDVQSENKPTSNLEVTELTAIRGNGYLVVSAAITNTGFKSMPWRSDWLRNDLFLVDGTRGRFILRGVEGDFGRNQSIAPGEEIRGFWYFQPDSNTCKNSKYLTLDNLDLELSHPRIKGTRLVNSNS